MRKQLTVKRGLDLRLAGGVPSGAKVEKIEPELIAVIPDDYPGFVPKTEVKEGETVEVGTPLLRDKNDETVKLVSPVKGQVKAVVRGARRKIERVEVIPEKGSEAVTGVKSDNGDVAALLRRYGLWSLMRQRPYDIVPRVGVKPRDIFVTALDTAPLAVMPSIDSLDSRLLAAGVKALKGLTSGDVYISVKAGSGVEIEGAVMVDVSGPHPAGNAGIQVANISPVNKGETVWTLDIVTLYRIGRLIADGVLDMTATVAVTGSEVANPSLVDTVIGADMKSLLKSQVASSSHLRVIAGNVLTGVKDNIEGFIHYPYRQVTVIPEGDNADEFMGWASLSPGKMSESRSFPGHFLKRLFRPDARINGGRRAMIMSGKYDKVLPMDILPEFLFKAITAGDIDRMEQLGIYEIAPEDVALCEYVDPSKLELQKLVRQGIDTMRREEA